MLKDMQINRNKIELDFKIDPSMLKSMQESTRKSV